jgi:glycerol-1-phosphate dehydrogenase [NAD(P)+]
MIDNILKLNINEMVNLNFNCECGKTHKVHIENIIVKESALKDLESVIDGFKDKSIFLVADKNTYKVCGEKIENELKKKGYNLQSYVFYTNSELVPDEKSVGRLTIEIPKNTSLILAIGSGTINDICRFISYKLDVPYIIIATAPSMDGYASTVSPLIVEGFKTTYEAVYPKAIIADTSILKDAPLEMIHAGFGDILGKYTSLSDWKLSKIVNNEYYCQNTVNLVEKAREECVKNAEYIKNRSEKVIRQLTEALIISGIAIGFIGYSRPASGAEHHIAHYWEMAALNNKQPHSLHGNSVGAATLIVSMIYQLMKDKIPKEIKAPDPEFIISIHEKVGSVYNPKDLGIPKEVFADSIIHAREIRNRYTILQLAYEYNLLEKFSKILTQAFY